MFRKNTSHLQPSLFGIASQAVSSQAQKAQEVERTGVLSISLLRDKRKRFLGIVLRQLQQTECSGQLACVFHTADVSQQLDD